MNIINRISDSQSCVDTTTLKALVDRKIACNRLTQRHDKSVSPSPREFGPFDSATYQALTEFTRRGGWGAQDKNPSPPAPLP